MLVEPPAQDQVERGVPDEHESGVGFISFLWMTPDSATFRIRSAGVRDAGTVLALAAGLQLRPPPTCRGAGRPHREQMALLARLGHEMLTDP